MKEGGREGEKKKGKEEKKAGQEGKTKDEKKARDKGRQRMKKEREGGELGGKTDRRNLTNIYGVSTVSDSVRKNPPASAGDAEDVGFIPGSGRSPGIGNGNPF